MMKLAFVIVPSLAILLWVGLEMPRAWRRTFFKLPVFVTSSAFALLIGAVTKGVLGPISGFVAELILWPGLALIKWFTNYGERREILIADGKVIPLRKKLEAKTHEQRTGSSRRN